MASFNAMEEGFEEVTILGQPALFTSVRINRASVPRGYYQYEVRHDDDYNGVAQIARGIMVNHWGTLIVREEIKLHSDGYLDIAPEDLNYSTGDCSSMEDYMQKYPAKAQRSKDCAR